MTHKWHKWIGTVILTATVMLIGCATNQSGPEAFRIQAERITTFALLAEDAPVETAEKVRDLSINLQELVSLSWSQDEIKAKILSYIRDELEGRNQALAIYLTNEITNMVLLKLDAGEILPTELKVYVLAAASGIESGADIYILMISDEPTDTE